MPAPPDAPITVRTSRPEELVSTFHLIFQDIQDHDRSVRVQNAVEMVRNRELEPDGIFVAEQRARLVGAMVAMPAAGAGGTVWPPRVLEHSDQAAVEAELVSHSIRWLRNRGVKFAQALLPPEDVKHAEPLTRYGFHHVTDLFYMRHYLSKPASAVERLEYQTFDNCNPDLFRATLDRTYERTADCPELNDVRDAADVIAGHKAQKKGGLLRWWLVFAEKTPIGVLLLTKHAHESSWDLAYVGVVPDSRQNGFGREMVTKAINDCRDAQALELTLAVDVRNVPAIGLYRSLDFVEVERRHVYLAIWSAFSERPPPLHP